MVTASTRCGLLISRRSVLLATSTIAVLGAAPAPARGGRLPALRIKAQRAVSAGAPISFGHAFAKGDLPAGSALTITPPGSSTPVQCQMDQVNRWSDGSVRMARFHARLPSAMAAGQVAKLQLGTTTGAPLSGGTITPAMLAAANIDIKIKAHGYSYDAGALVRAGGGPPPLSAFSQVNFVSGAAAAANRDGTVTLRQDRQGGDNFSMLLQALGGGPRTVTARVATSLPRDQYYNAGLIARCAATGKLALLGLPRWNYGRALAQHYNSPSGYGGEAGNGDVGDLTKPVYVRATWDGTAVTLLGSSTGGVNSWVQVGQVPASTLGGAPDQVGLFINAHCEGGNTAPGSITVLDWETAAGAMPQAAALHATYVQNSKPDMFTVSLADIFQNFRDGRAGNKDFGGSALGGWERVNDGPVCTSYRAWRYLKRDGDGASHPYVKAVIYADFYPNGAGGYSYRVLPVIKQSNAHGPHPAATVVVPDILKQATRGGIYELWDGNTRLHSWGGTGDPNTLTLPASAIRTRDGAIVSGLDAWKNKGAAYTVVGANVPAPLPAAPLYLSTNALLYFSRSQAFQNKAHGSPAWAAGPVPQYHSVAANGALWISLNAGRATQAPVPTNPQGGVCTTADGVRWHQVTAAFSPTQSPTVQLVPVIATPAGSAAPLALPDATMVWAGEAGVNKLVIGPDPNYLMAKSRAITPLNPNGTPPSYDPSWAIPYRPGVPYFFNGRASFTATGDGLEDNCIGWLGPSPANLAMNPLDPVNEQDVRNLGFGMADVPMWWEDYRTGRPVHGGTKTWPGFIPNPSIHYYEGHPGAGSPAWQGTTDNYYENYGFLLDGSHMPSPWIMNYIRDGHPFWGDLASAQTFTMFNCSFVDARNVTSGDGVERDYNFIYGPGVQTRTQGWNTRQHTTLAHLLDNGEAAWPVIKDAVDGVGTYCGIVESEFRRNAYGANTNFGNLKLGVLFATDGDGVQGDSGVKVWMYGHFASAVAMEAWRGERPGFKTLSDAFARWLPGAYTAPNATSILDMYAVAIQPTQGQQAYPDWGTVWWKNGRIPSPAGPYPVPSTNVGCGSAGAMGLAAIGMRCALGDATARAVWNAARAVAGGPQSIQQRGVGNYSGHPFMSATYMICPPDQVPANL